MTHDTFDATRQRMLDTATSALSADATKKVLLITVDGDQVTVHGLRISQESTLEVLGALLQQYIEDSVEVPPGEVH